MGIHYMTCPRCKGEAHLTTDDGILWCNRCGPNPEERETTMEAREMFEGEKGREPPEPNDLVQRLREEAQSYQSNAWNRPDGGQDFSLAAVSLELAADEIDRLRGNVARLTGAIMTGETDMPDWVPLAKALFQIEHDPKITDQFWYDFQGKAQLLLAKMKEQP